MLIALLLTAAPLTVDVDMREAPRRLVHARLSLPASPGEAVWVYPKWLPGKHSPTGPITDVASVAFFAKGKPLAWTRDAEDPYAFHVTVPAGVDRVEATLDYLAPPPARSAGIATATLAVLEWSDLMLYPKGTAARDVTVQPSLRYPLGWKWGTSLELEAEANGRVAFKPVSLETLVDSPVAMGRYAREYTLGTKRGAPHTMFVVAESEEATVMPAEVEGFHKRLVDEALALFGARHYERYRFLVTLSDSVDWLGLEHHSSSDNRIPERSLIDPVTRLPVSSLLAHELAHSWNGKYRRPAGLATPHYQAPMKGELLWVYEGLTTYLGNVLAARAGAVSAEEFRAQFAWFASMMEGRGGRAWRPLADTATAAQNLYFARGDWTGRRRSVDFYPEGSLLWLEVDTLIRAQTKGGRSLDDFVRAFFGGADSAPEVRPYELADVVAALNEVAPYDWSGFFAERVYRVAPHAPLRGLGAAGWRLELTDTPNPVIKARDALRKQLDLSASLGLVLSAEDATIKDVLPGTPADKAGLAPAMKVVALNGRRFTREWLELVLDAAKKKRSVEVLTENVEHFQTYTLSYAGGPRWPTLVRDEKQPDVLSAIIAPLAR